MADDSETQTSKLHAVYITIIVILLVVIAGGFYYYHRQTAGANGMKMSHTGSMREMMGMSMAAVTPPQLDDQQSQQLLAGTSQSTTQKTFNIIGGNYYFVPNKITVNKGDQVTFIMTNAGGVHDLVITELGVKTPIIHTAQTATVTFTATKAGSFVYYCSLPGHQTKGMWGTLIVE